MNKVVTRGIVLNRINYGEADRILTIITPDHGKISVIAKGVRKEKSKLAGGVELFTVNEISYIPGKREVSTLISTRLKTNFGNIVKDLGRTTFGYEVLKIINKVTEEECGGEFFAILTETLAALNSDIDIVLIEDWFIINLLKLMGHEPNLSTDVDGQKLAADQNFSFDYDAMAFAAHERGVYQDKHIKLLRLLLFKTPTQLKNLADIETISKNCKTLLKHLANTYFS